MLNKNQEFTVVIEEMGCNGEGIARIDGCAVFIPYALAGETVKIKILKAKPTFAFGKLIEVLIPSEKRAKPVCSVFNKCGGCNLQHLNYDDQLVWKGESVADCFKKIAGITLPAVKAEGSENVYRYRNKLQLPIRQTKNGVSIGLFRENSHDVIDVKDCPIQRKWVADIIEVFHSYVKEAGETCFDDITSRGNLKHAVVREVSGEMLIVAVTVSGKLKNAELLTSLLKERFESFSLFINKNDLNNNVVMGKQFRLVYGKEKVVSNEGGISMPMGPESFMQVNDDVRKKIYAKVCELAGENNETVIDAYSGAGFLTAQLAKSAKRVYGIECVKEAVDCADKLARDNGLEDRITNICGLCEDVLPELITKISSENGKVTVVLDPPRKGCDRAVIEALLKVKPDKIVYVSCNPSTLARDVGLLCGSLEYIGAELKKSLQNKEIYNVDFLQPYDMFPQTKHVESVVCLSRAINKALNHGFRKAKQDDAEQVLSLYKNAKSGAFCVWNDSYPSVAEIEHDLETKNLYVLTDGGKAIGAISVVPENELDGFDCWPCKEAKEIARVVIEKAYQGQGLAYKMVQSIASILQKDGCKAIHLSVAKTNIPAYKTYKKAGFTVVGEAQMYGNDYYLMEKAIDTNTLS